MTNLSSGLIPSVASARVRRVRIRNYKSIGSCDIQLGGLTILVGRNGAGKSNFLNALRFITDGRQTSLGQALKTRGGIDQVRRKSTGHPCNFTLGVTLELPDHAVANYDFEIAARERGALAVKVERLVVKEGQVETKSRFTNVERPPSRGLQPARTLVSQRAAEPRMTI
ncbi:MAG: AAA family ATPase [Phycisphaerae bacterium]|nr:MAG: AAA family ATPase [Phycisphaerae bacterium]MBE7458065.1 AAA family ATPase [Planctomycetia bacterium]MCK6464471.1 AAA family ATPase [Phycisphaerae bacterium]MCL4717979.1 AAA family ATPase [Phycisphaerae bacterium]